AALETGRRHGSEHSAGQCFWPDWLPDEWLLLRTRMSRGVCYHLSVGRLSPCSFRAPIASDSTLRFLADPCSLLFSGLFLHSPKIRRPGLCCFSAGLCPDTFLC